MNESQTKAISDHAAAMVQHEYDYQRERHPERFAAATDEQKREYEARILADATRTAESILSDDETWIRRVWSGALHPDNKATRKLFTALTGHLLPPQVAATKAVVEELYGPQIAAFRAAKKAERDASEAARKAQWDAHQQGIVDDISAKVRQGAEISGECLYTLARHLGIEVHPRTVGTLRNRVRSISENTGRIAGKGHAPMSVFHLYRDCRAMLLETA